MADLGDNPHLRKRAGTQEDGAAADPDAELALRRRNDADLDHRPGHLGDLLLQTAALTAVRDTGEVEGIQWIKQLIRTSESQWVHSLQCSFNKSHISHDVPMLSRQEA